MTEARVAWTVPPRNPQALCGAILEALGSPESRSERGLRGQHRARTQFTAGQMVQKTLEVYSELLPREAAA